MPVTIIFFFVYQIAAQMLQPLSLLLRHTLNLNSGSINVHGGTQTVNDSSCVDCFKPSEEMLFNLLQVRFAMGSLTALLHRCSLAYFHNLYPPIDRMHAAKG